MNCGGIDPLFVKMKHCFNVKQVVMVLYHHMYLIFLFRINLVHDSTNCTF